MKINGIVADRTMRGTGIRAEVYDYLLSVLESKEIIELHEVVEDLVTKLANTCKDDIKKAQELNLKLSKRNDEHLKEIKLIRDENIKLRKEVEKGYEMYNELLFKYNKLKGDMAMTNPEAKTERTVNIHESDLDMMRRKIDVLIEAIRMI